MKHLEPAMQPNTEVPLVQKSSASEPSIMIEKVPEEPSFDTELGEHDAVKKQPRAEWKAGKQEWLVMVLLLVVSLLASIDATILVPVLPVSSVFR